MKNIFVLLAFLSNLCKLGVTMTDILSYFTIHRSSPRELFLGKYAANLQENIHANCDFNKVAKEIVQCNCIYIYAIACKL